MAGQWTPWGPYDPQTAGALDRARKDQVGEALNTNLVQPMSNLWNSAFQDAMPPDARTNDLVKSTIVDPNDFYQGYHDSIHGQVGNYHYSTADDPYEPDPIMGYDCEIFVERYDSNSGAILKNDGTIRNEILLGQFQEIQVMVSSRTMKFLEMDSRTPFLLDEEFAFPFVLSKGYIDVNLFEQTYGLRAINHMIRFGRLPRMRITFNTDTRSLDPMGIPRGELNQTVALRGTQNIQTVTANLANRNLVTGASPADRARLTWVRNVHNPDSINPLIDRETLNSGGATIDSATGKTFYGGDRFPNGKIMLLGAKCNDLILHAAGVGVIKNQWKGEAEGLQTIVFKEIGEYDPKKSNNPLRYGGTRKRGETLDYLFHDIDGFKHEPINGDLASAANTRDPGMYNLIAEQAYQQELAQNEIKKNMASQKVLAAVQQSALTGLAALFGQKR